MSTATLNRSVSADEAEILALGADLHKAHFEKDPEGIAAPFAPHAVGVLRDYTLSRSTSTNDAARIAAEINQAADWARNVGNAD